MERLSSNAKRLLHDKCLDDLVKRLATKPGFLCPEAEYVVEKDGVEYRGECDVRKITRNSKGVKFQRYYEVKHRDNHYFRRKAQTQFRRHAACHEGNWQYIYVTPTKLIKYTSKILKG